MDRLAPIINERQMLRGFLILVVGVIAAYFVAPKIVGSDWGGFATTLCASIPLLGWLCQVFAKKRRQDNAIETEQLQALGSALKAKERLPFGFVTASDEGIGLTYFPMTEVLVRWQEIRSVTFCQFGKVLTHVAFDPESTVPKIRNWSKPVIILKTSRDDFPLLPVVFDNSASAIRWLKIFESRRSPEERFFRNALPWKRRLSNLELSASMVSVFGAAIALGVNTSTLPHASENAFFGIFIGGQLVSATSSLFSNFRENGANAIIQAMCPQTDRENPHRIAPMHPIEGALWCSEESNIVERIPVASIRSATVKLKKSDWMSRSLFKPAPLDQADLTLELDRSHDKTRTFKMTKSGAEASIAALLAERPDLKIHGAPDLVLQPTA